MNKNPDIQKIREIAENYCKSRDFYCSEAVIKSLIDEFEVEIPQEVIAMASGLPVGIGGSGCSCGAFLSGAMCLGLIFGRTTPNDPRITHAMTLSSELHSKFIDLHNVCCCRVLTQNVDFGSPEQMSLCSSIVGDVAAETAKIIIRELASIV